MANLPEETKTTVLNLQRRLLQLINEATASEFIILEPRVIADAGDATVREVKRDWNLP